MTQLEKELETVNSERAAVITIGVFDGVHIGHQALIAETMRQAKEHGFESGVVTFAGHPRQVLDKHKDLAHLNSLEQRLRFIKELGVDQVIALTFSNELASLSAEEFIRLLVKHLKLKSLVIGPDFALGKGREGNVASLKALGEQLSVKVTVVPPVLRNGHKVSSTMIRTALAESKMATVHELLGRYFSLEGTVVRGEGRGATLGIPTANIEITPDQALPADGVYATVACIEANAIGSVTNIGTRPTFGGGQRTVETHLLDYAGDLYGQRLEIAIIEQIRPEKEFGSVDELLVQIKDDINKTRKVLKKTGCF